MFDLGNAELETERGAVARAAWLGLKIALLALSSLTTALFFLTYAGGAFTELAGDFSPYLAALTGVLVLDGGAVVWSYLRASHASTVPQMAIASVASWCDLTGALLTTVLYLTLRSAFEVGIYDNSGNLSALGATLHYIGLAVIIGGVAGNFLATFVYTMQDASVRLATQRRQMESLAAGARFRADSARLELTTRAALAEISTALPELATTEGRRLSADYLTTHMPTARNRGNLAPVVYDLSNTAKDAGGAAVPLSANGHPADGHQPAGQ